MKQVLLLSLLITGMAVSRSVAQSKATTIHGKVISSDASLPLEGAGVIVKGTNNATGTMFDGTFSITVSEKDSTLIISLEGYQKEEVKITTATDYEIQLKPTPNLAAYYMQRLQFFVRTRSLTINSSLNNI